MKTLLDSDSLRDLAPPGTMEAYLKKADWRALKADPAYSLWAAPSDERIRVVVPRDAGYVDYPLRVTDVLRKLASVEHRDPESIAQDLPLAMADEIYLKAKLRGDALTSLPPYQDGVRAVQSLGRMLTAAACAASRPRPYYSSAKSDEVARVLGDLLLGHTQRGSFIVTAVCPIPVPSPLDDVHLDIDATTYSPFQRRTTEILATSLQAVSEALKEAHRVQSLQPFMRMVPQGVSANLCDSVAKLHEARSIDSIQVGIAWAGTIPKPAPERVPNHISFNHVDFPTLRDAGDFLRRESMDEHVTLRGVVIRLEWPPERPFGRITIKASVQGKRRNVTIDLPGPEYHVACIANSRCSSTRTMESARRTRSRAPPAPPRSG